MHIVGGHASSGIANRVSHTDLFNRVCSYEVAHILQVLRAHIVVVGALE